MNTEQLTLEDYARTTRQSIRSKTTRTPITGTDFPTSPQPRKKRRGSSSATEQPKPDGLVYPSNRPSSAKRQHLRRQIIARDNGICQYCGYQHSATDKPIMEHVIPERRNGPTEPHNVVIACGTCNITKGNFVWIPRNLESITKDKDEHRSLILALAEQDKATMPKYPRWSIRATIDGERSRHTVYDEQEAIAIVTDLVQRGAIQLDWRCFRKAKEWKSIAESLSIQQ